jgi:hypothetical protein
MDYTMEYRKDFKKEYVTVKEFTHVYQGDKLLIAKNGFTPISDIIKLGFKGRIRIEYSLDEYYGALQKERYIVCVHFIKDGLKTGTLYPFGGKDRLGAEEPK